MRGDVDPRLIGLLQGVLGLADCLRDAGAKDGMTVRLSREDGLALLGVAVGASDPEAEACSQRGRQSKPGMHSLKIANMTFEWPRADAATQRPETARMFSSRPPVLAAPANDNSLRVLRFYGFEEETPALR